MYTDEQLSEGLRVTLQADIRTCLPVPFNRRKVIAPNGVPWVADIIPAGTTGTVFQHRIRKGMPCLGLPHAMAWGVSWDGVPPHESPKNTYGLQLGPAPEVPPELAALRARWVAALEARRAVEAEGAARWHEPVNSLGGAFWARHEAAVAWAEQLRREYDAAAGLPDREV